MHLLRFLSVTAFGVVFLGLSSSARAAGGGDHENVAASHADDAVVAARQSDPAIGPPRDPNARRDPSMFSWGLGMSVTGGLSMISGAVVAMVGMTDAICIKWNDGDCPRAAAGQRLVNTDTVMVAAGSVLLGIGLPLAIVGGRHVKASEPPPMTASIVPVVGPGQAGSSFTLTF